MSYCPACEEEAPSSQDGICLTCGEELTSPPNDGGSSRGQSVQQPAEAPRQDVAATMALLASSMDGAAAMNIVNQLRGGAPTENGGEGGSLDDLAGILPPEALNPQAGAAKSRPASQTALDNLKRTTLTPQSAELFDAQVHLFEPRLITDLSPCTASSGCLSFNSVPGEFGPLHSSSGASGKSDDHQRLNAATRTAAIVVCSPRTTKGGKLSAQTMSEIAFLRQNRMPFYCYVERGDGVTFVQKALICQRAGEDSAQQSHAQRSKSDSFCIGVIVGNATSGGTEVWPYTMQDTKNEAELHGLTVPVVMIRRDDGMRLVQWATSQKEKDNLYTPCRLDIRSKEANSHTCPVCTDSYAPGDTIIRLPLCGHVFHESCALAWLTKHNTCPYCRKELPTDDDDYERERRRREALGSSDGDASNNVSFYG